MGLLHLAVGLRFKTYVSPAGVNVTGLEIMGHVSWDWAK